MYIYIYDPGFRVCGPLPPLGMGPKISPLAFSALGLGFRLQYGRRKLERNALWECNLRLQNSLESNEQIAEISRDLIHRTGAMHQAIRGSKVKKEAMTMHSRLPIQTS